MPTCPHCQSRHISIGSVNVNNGTMARFVKLCQCASCFGDFVWVSGVGFVPDKYFTSADAPIDILGLEVEAITADCKHQELCRE